MKVKTLTGVQFTSSIWLNPMMPKPIRNSIASEKWFVHISLKPNNCIVPSIPNNREHSYGDERI
jgi:hypothetical protein